MVMVEEKQAIVFVRDEISELILLVATDKGAFLYYSDGDRRHGDVSGPHVLGSIIHHIVLDPRDNKTLLASVQSRHSECTIFRSNDFGKTWIPSKNTPKIFSCDCTARPQKHPKNFPSEPCGAAKQGVK